MKGQLENAVIKNKLDRRWWRTFVRGSHYFEKAAALGRLKQEEYLGFIKKTPLEKSFILKTDLFVEAKALEDNYLPQLRHSNSFVGMDISMETAKLARTKLSPVLPGMNFIVCDAMALPFQSNAFDAIISDSTLDHLPLSKLPQTLEDLARILKDQGNLILSLNSVFNLPAVFMRKVRNAWDPDWFYTFSISLTRVRRLLEKTGFQIQDSAYILPLHPFEIALLRMAHRKKIAAHLADRWVFFFQKIVKKTFLSPVFCMQFIICAKKRNRESDLLESEN